MASVVAVERQADNAKSHDEVLARVRALTSFIRDKALDAEEARTVACETVDALLAAGICRILVPTDLGGYGLGLDTWFEVVREIATADASHAWCASLMIHHPHYVSQFAEEAQKAVWANGLDIAIAASILPSAKVTPAKGGFNISGQFPFASGINHSQWVIVGGMVLTTGEPEWIFFLIGPGKFQVVDTWFMVGMRATGSNTAVSENVFIPASHTIRLAELIEGSGPGGAIHAGPIYRAPFISYAPLTFVTPILGAAQGAYELFREMTKGKTGAGGISIAGLTSIQVRLARAAADLECAELLLRRAVETAQARIKPSLELRARTMRDCSRASELCVGVIDMLLAMSGTAGFATTNPMQRAWRDIHFASMHVSLNPELNFAYFGRRELGLPRDEHYPFY
jgi:3-hydroxy-9,10-secoandrosta-1,3,5(10)-triene-9,17-dione monooxygenase